MSTNMPHGPSSDIITDSMPQDVTISDRSIVWYVLRMVWYFIDLCTDINVAAWYLVAGMMAEFGWTLAFIVLPAFIITAVSVRMYAQDKELDSVSVENTKLRWFLILVLQMSPVVRTYDTLKFAFKSRQAQSNLDPATQRRYYGLMLKEDSDAALLKIFETFLEAAPQLVLQTTLLLRYNKEFAAQQILSICTSVGFMGWSLASYHKAIRFAQHDKLNVSELGRVLLVLWHFHVSLSRVTSILIIAYLFPEWAILACCLHILVMTICLQLFDRPPLCSHNKAAEIAFSFALGAVYLFTYILPKKGKTKGRYSVYYSICFLQNIVCGLIWYFYASEEMRSSVYFPLILLGTVVPYCIGIAFMVLYYAFLHPSTRARQVIFAGEGLTALN